MLVCLVQLQCNSFGFILLYFYFVIFTKMSEQMNTWMKTYPRWKRLRLGWYLYLLEVRKYVFSSGETLGISIIPALTSCSREVSQNTMDSSLFVCLYLITDWCGLFVCGFPLGSYFILFSYLCDFSCYIEVFCLFVLR